VKIANFMLAGTLAVLGLSCSSQGYNHSGLAKILSMQRNKAASWDQIDNKKEDGSASLRRLESVTWDSVKHELTWDVSRGEKSGDSYQPQAKDRYEINMDSATMTVNGESRRFSEDEASNVRTLMNFISRYALESTVWWENGEGDPVDGSATPTKPERQVPLIPKEEGNAKAIHILAMMSTGTK
jgi:hypothetical protein